jgi:RNA polymerase sigma-70 factor (ECF subfamily)
MGQIAGQTVNSLAMFRNRQTPNVVANGLHRHWRDPMTWERTRRLFNPDFLAAVEAANSQRPAPSGERRFDANTFEDAYRRYFPLIVSKCKRMLGDTSEAQDVAQDAFARLWRGRDQLQGELAISAWLYRTCTRLAIDKLRQRRRGPGLSDGVASLVEQLVADGASPEYSSSARQLLARLLTTISVPDLEVGILSRVDELTHEEMARVLAISERTVRRRLVRFRVRLERFRQKGGS